MMAEWEKKLRPLIGDASDASFNINSNANGDVNLNYSLSTLNGIRRTNAISIPAALKAK